jgi:hypothetical protein
VKNKILLAVLCAFFALISISGCKRNTVFDPYMPTESCYDFGKYANTYDYYWWSNGIYYGSFSIDRDKTITGISIGVTGSDSAIVYLCNQSGTVLSHSTTAGTDVSDGWNTISIPPVAIQAGVQYKLGVQLVSYPNSSGIRSTTGGDMYYLSNTWGTVPANLSGGSYNNYTIFIYGNYCP